MSDSIVVKRVPFDITHVTEIKGVYPATCTVSPPLSGKVDSQFLTYLHQSVGIVDVPTNVRPKDFVVDAEGLRFTTTEDHVATYLAFTDTLIARANQVRAEHQEARAEHDDPREVLERLKILTGK